MTNLKPKYPQVTKVSMSNVGHQRKFHNFRAEVIVESFENTFDQGCNLNAGSPNYKMPVFLQYRHFDN